MDAGLLFLKAGGVGVAVAAPVGPMSLLCMRRSLTCGWQKGLLTGLGTATGDCTHALIAAAGLTGLSHFLLLHARPLHFAAALALFYFGISALRSRTTERAPPAGRSTYLGSVLLTLTNPATIIAFAAFFTVLAPAGRLGFGAVGLTAGGVFAGSLLWWCGLVAVISAFRATIGS
ncbi:MAG: LysE family translocator, partial [Acetobacteraceae bacterium]